MRRRALVLLVVAVLLGSFVRAEARNDGGWRRFEKVGQGFPPGSSINDVEWLGNEFVAVGEVYPANGPGPTAGLWRSADGRNWAASSAPEGATSLSAVVRSGGRVWVAGSSTKQDPTATLWSSTDDAHWAQGIELGPPRTYVSELIVVRGALVASGGQTTGPASSVGWIWRVTGDTVIERKELPGIVEALARNGDDLVALISLPELKGRRALTYVSNDAWRWSEDTNIGWSVDPGGGTLGQWNESLLAAVYPRSGSKASSVLWRRTAGAWSRVRSLPPGAVVDQIVDVGEYVIATGFDRSRPGGFASRDGRSWKSMRITRPQGGRLNATASNGATVVAFGTAPELGDFYLWERPPG